MIALPRLLTEQLQLVDGDLQRRLAVDYAEHAVEQTAVVDTAAGAFLEFIRSARQFLDCEMAIGDLVESRARFFPMMWAASGLVSSAAEVVHLALNASCQRDFERADVVVRSKHQPSVIEVANAGQALAGRLASGRDPGSDGRGARWEECRWQLLRLIEVVPEPSRSSAT